MPAGSTKRSPGSTARRIHVLVGVSVDYQWGQHVTYLLRRTTNVEEPASIEYISNFLVLVHMSMES